MRRLLPCLFIMLTFINYSQVRLVKDINLAGSSTPTEPFLLGNTLYFSANEDATGRELWKTDGTENGTVLVADYFSGTNSSEPSRFIALNNNEFLFRAKTTGVGRELVISDGNNITLFEDFHLGGPDSNPDYLIEANIDGSDKVYLVANRNGASSVGVEIFAIDKVTKALTQITDINPNGHSFPAELFHYNATSMILFRAGDANGDRELYGYDGNNVTLIKDINPNGSSNPQNFFEFNGEVYFNADDSIHGQELWKTDGTETGTLMVSDISVGNSDGNPERFNEFNGSLYFRANKGNGRELWKTDGTSAGTVEFEINISGASNPSRLFLIGNIGLFTADNGSSGTELFSIDTSDNIQLVEDIWSGNNGSNPSNFVEYNGNVYFSATDQTNTSSTGNELYRYNSVSGTVELVGDFSPGLLDTSPLPLAVLNNELIFSGLVSSFSVGRELFAYNDGNPLSTDQINLTSPKLFPNPTNKSFTLINNSSIDLKKVEIYNNLGKRLKNYEIQSSYNIEDLSTGIYFVKVMDQKNRSKTIKLIKS